MMRSQRFRVAITVLAASLLASPGRAQTADDLFDDAQLHDVSIHINARDWDQLRAAFLENTFYPCDVEWRSVRVRNAGCRSRGTGSRNGQKPGLRIDFNHYVTGQTFLGLRSLVLDNLWQDASMIKERLSMRFFARLGLPAPREAHARIYVGSAREYLGLYAVVEEIDELFLRRYFNHDDGYLYEYRWVNEYGFEDLGPELEPYALRFEARTHVNDSMFSLYVPIRDLVVAINESPEMDLEASLSRLFGMPALLKHLAAENYLAEWDGLAGYAGLDNFYLHRAEGTGAFQFLVWDKDLTFLWLEMPPWHNFDRNVLTRRIWANPRLRTAYLQTMLEAANAARELEHDAERMYGQIRAAALDDARKPYSNEQFEKGIDDVRRFARERGAVVRSYVGELTSTADVRAEITPTRYRPELPIVPVGPERQH